MSQVLLTDNCQLMLYFSDMENRITDIAKFIRKARSSLGMTQEVFAERLGYTKGNVSAWEKGKYEPPYQILKSISELSGVPLPNDKTQKILEVLGLDLKEMSLDDIEYFKAAMAVPKEGRPFAKKIFSAFSEENGEKKKAK